MIAFAAIVLFLSGLAVAYAAVAYVSLALGFVAVACVLGAAAVALLGRAQGGARPSAPPPARTAARDEPDGLIESRAQVRSALSALTESPLPEGPPQDDTVEVAIGTPRALDAASVLEVLVSTAGSAGHAVRATLWRGDGAGESGAVPVATFGEHRDDLVRSRDAVHEVLRDDRAVLESLAIADGDLAGFEAWRYIVPITFGDVKGAVGLDFVGARPDMELLNRTAAAYRVQLAAALALEVAEREYVAASVLMVTVRELTRVLDPEQIVKTTLARALQVAEATTGSVMLYDEAGADLRIVASVGLPEDVVHSTIVRAGDGIAGWVALSCQPLVVEDAPGESPRARSRDIRSAASVPIADSDGVLGVLNVGSAQHPSRLVAGDLAVLEIIAAEAAAALRNARSQERNADVYFDTLMALAIAIESKDPYAEGQTARVVRHARDTARELGLSPGDTRVLELAAVLRDIGMPTGCEEPYGSRQHLSAVERNLLTLHPVIAAEILDQAPALREVAPIVSHHHEHFDGSGYAEGLAGGDIPLGARILSVADAFVALTSPRPYRESQTEAQAVVELRRAAGTQFDPVVVEAFVATRSSVPEEHLGSAR